jgi:hypothetical protein
VLHPGSRTSRWDGFQLILHSLGNKLPQVMPCSAALDFARRKIASRISSVIFMNLIVLDLVGGINDVTNTDLARPQSHGLRFI